MKKFILIFGLIYLCRSSLSFLSKKSEKSIRGFTLIELLIVISILGVLATFALTTFPAAQGRSRDARRQSDLKQYQTALETYANNNNGRYPTRTAAVDPSTLCGSGSPLNNLTNCPVDPVNGNDTCASGSGTCSYVYRYITNSGFGGFSTEYAIWARLRRPSSPVNLFFIVCSDGRAGTSTTEPTSSTVCPL